MTNTVVVKALILLWILLWVMQAQLCENLEMRRTWLPEPSVWRMKGWGIYLSVFLPPGLLTPLHSNGAPLWAEQAPRVKSQKEKSRKMSPWGELWWLYPVAQQNWVWNRRWSSQMGQGTPKASVTSNNIFVFLIRKLKFSERVVQFSKIAQHIGAREKSSMCTVLIPNIIHFSSYHVPLWEEGHPSQWVIDAWHRKIKLLGTDMLVKCCAMHILAPVVGR